MSMPRVCFVLPGIYSALSGSRAVRFAGGAELQYTIAAKALVQAGYAVSVVCLDHGQPDGEVIDGVTVFKTHRPEGGVPILRFLYPRLACTWQAMRRAEADIYCQPCAAYLTGIVAAFCRTLRRKSVFAGASDTDFMLERLRLRSIRDRLMYRWGVRRVDAIIAQTPRQQQLCAKGMSREAVLIPNGYALSGVAVANRCEYVLWVGNIRSVKRPERFLELARCLPQVKFRMIGGPIADADDGGGYYEGIKAEAARIPNLEFLGFLPYAETELHFDHAAVFVNTSDVEGFPNTFLQAWARGVPTVSYFDPVLAEAGVFTKVDSVLEAAAAIDRLIADRVVWQGYSAACKAYFQRYHAIEAVVPRYADLFDRLMKGAAR